MLIGIISDTHISKDISFIENFIKTNLKEVDIIIHLGDFIENSVYELLKSTKKFIGVFGNNDDLNIKGALNEKDILEINNIKIGLYHGHGMGKTSMERAYEKLKDDKVDVIIFGHSHMPLIETKNKILFINPGSPCNKRKERWYSYILLKLEGKNISAELKLWENKNFFI